MRRYGQLYSAFAAVGAGLAGGYATLLAAAALYELVPDLAALGHRRRRSPRSASGRHSRWSSETIAGIGLDRRACSCRSPSSSQAGSRSSARLSRCSCSRRRRSSRCDATGPACSPVGGVAALAAGDLARAAGRGGRRAAASSRSRLRSGWWRSRSAWRGSCHGRSDGARPPRRRIPPRVDRLRRVGGRTAAQRRAARREPAGARARRSSRSSWRSSPACCSGAIGPAT